MCKVNSITFTTNTPIKHFQCMLCILFRADSRLAPSQWETSLQSNTVSHWLGANLESALPLIHESLSEKPTHQRWHFGESSLTEMFVWIWFSSSVVFKGPGNKSVSVYGIDLRQTSSAWCNYDLIYWPLYALPSTQCNVLKKLRTLACVSEN